jgi:two-component system sensor histidine kinase KdpD
VSEIPRPDPDALMRLVERESDAKGKLKIFFGMAAGVGKTYSMLQEAGQRRKDGLDAVIGYLEPHGRKETEDLAEGLEAVPRKRLEYRGRTFEEMDVDAVAERRPALVLVDELAHTNASGSRNRKRFQDVREILDKGIDVFTTMNVQHLESFADTVEEISGVPVSERVPDSVFDEADQVVLIDLSPEELLTRLAEGKVYTGEMAAAARENFFKKSTLTALREMALRHTALMVNHQLTDYAEETRRQTLAGTSERLLVALSPSPNSAHLLRWTRQRAYTLKAEWIALYVETGASLSDRAKESLGKNLTLARQLGASVISIPSDNVSAAILGYARANRVTEIVAGKSGLRRGGLLARSSITEEILSGSGDIDVTVVQEKGRNLTHVPQRDVTPLLSETLSMLKMLGAIVLVTGGGLAITPLIGYRSVGMLYLLMVIGLAFFVGKAAVMVSAVLSAVTWDFLFIPPRFTFTIGRLEDVLMLVLYFVAAAAMAFLMSRLRSNERMLKERQRKMELLYAFSEELSTKRSVMEISRAGIGSISRYFEAETALYLYKDQGGLDPNPMSLGGTPFDEKEFGVASWCFLNRTPCGKYTDTLHGAGFHYIPLVTPDSTVGVIGIRLPEGKPWMKDQEDFLQTLGRTLSLSLGRELLAEENRKNLMAMESERLSKTLLNTVSHELRTPLTTIKGAVTALMDPSTCGDAEARRILLSETLMASDRLNGIVENLLNMSRLESGMLRLKKSDTDILDLASVVADALRRQTTDHPFSINIDESVQTVSVDFVLMVQVLANIVQNAVHYSPAGTPIELAVSASGTDAVITVSDAGPGVAADELPHLFERFFRGRRAASGGVGLGLSLCKGIVEAHGGRISAFINSRGGLSVSIMLPEGARGRRADVRTEGVS